MAALNCRQGDLAIVVRRESWMSLSVLGTLVRTVSFLGRSMSVQGHESADVWHVEFRDQIERDGHPLGMPDACLRPIRDPGHDATDEIVELVGVAPKVFALEDSHV